MSTAFEGVTTPNDRVSTKKREHVLIMFLSYPDDEGMNKKYLYMFTWDNWQCERNYRRSKLLSSGEL